MLIVSTWMPTEPATEASSDFPPAPARPQTMKSFVSAPGVIASTVIPAPVTVASVPTLASFVRSWTLRPTAAAMFELASRFVLSPIAFAFASTWFDALTLTRPVLELTSALAPIEARFVVTTQLTAIAAAMLTPPPCSPDSPPAWLLPSPALSFAFGTDEPLTPLSLVFGLSSTCFSVLSSALSSLSLVPFALASASALLSTREIASTVIAPSASTSRAISAVVDQPTTMLIATSAPTAALLPAASASAVVSETSVSWSACTVTVPVALSAVPSVPSRASTTSSLIRTNATAGVTETSPSEPAFTVVFTSRSYVALTVTSSAFVSVASFSTSAPTRVGTRMFSATEAPTPTSEPSASASAVAMSASFATAVIETSPLPTSMSANGGPRVGLPRMTASCRSSTMLMASAPATPMSSAAAPDLASAVMRWVESLGAARMSAASVRPSESTSTPAPTTASTVISAKLIATAAPTPVAPSAALASAFAFASVSPLAVRSSSPPATMLTSSEIAATVFEVAMLIEIAAATVTESPPLSPVAAFGVSLLPESFLEFAWSRLPSACPLTSLPPDSDSFLPPLALAVDVLSVVDEPIACMVIAPSAVTSRSSIACTS